jgi:biopolymer transport protein ExbD
VSLPDSETSEKRDTAGTVTSRSPQEGTLAWNKDLVTLQEFLDRLSSTSWTESNPRILINGDERAYFAQVPSTSSTRCASPRSTKIYIETRIVQPEKPAPAP